MSRITPDEVERIAGLARLSLDADELERMARDLDGILDYVDQLAALDTAGVEETSHVAFRTTPMREDRARPGLEPARAVAAAPRADGTTFVVPKVIEGGEG